MANKNTKQNTCLDSNQDLTVWVRLVMHRLDKPHRQVINLTNAYKLCRVDKNVRLVKCTANRKEMLTKILGWTKFYVDLITG